ncbi:MULTISPECIES: hypothetical protein [Microcoleaceae]|uniref:hypothetical protein n=1 Tax=Microcoleaceae TaxID=1892252 RepID=UPI0018818242|nr:hypothetical protein [Tychonema sp. LEGE 06208]MBE9162279.1 hypothetical protein [Tychonema sp. LEGE 06208]
MILIPVIQVKSGCKPQSFDTSIEAELLMFQRLQRLTPQEKVTPAIDFNRAVRRLAISGIESQYKGEIPVLKRQEFIKMPLGYDGIKTLFYTYNWVIS